jgi:hypothetical protein
MTTCAMMPAVGVVNDHLAAWATRGEVDALRIPE